MRTWLYSIIIIDIIVVCTVHVKCNLSNQLITPYNYIIMIITVNIITFSSCANSKKNNEI